MDNTYTRGFSFVFGQALIQNILILEIGRKSVIASHIGHSTIIKCFLFKETSFSLVSGQQANGHIYIEPQ
jgi:hypothetical protein